MSRRPPAVHELVDCHPNLAVVRCPDDDADTFMRLAAEVAAVQDIDLEQFRIAPPVWQWFRINPCGGDCGEHGWHIGEPSGSGIGNWRGSYVKLMRQPCYLCQERPPTGGCCSSHNKALCHRCYRATHFVEICIEGCALCAAEGLSLRLERLAKAATS